MHKGQDHRMNVLKREIKIEESDSKLKDFREVDDYLKSVSQKFLKEPINLENLNKAYTEIAVNGNKTGETKEKFQQNNE
jgi:hypothetical protein